METRSWHVSAGNFERLFGGVYAMQYSDLGRHQRGPSARPATKVESFRTWRKGMERENREIAFEQYLPFFFSKGALVKCRPFVSEAGYRQRVEVLRHGFLISPT